MNLKVYVQWIAIFQRPAFMFNLQLRRGGEANSYFTSILHHLKDIQI